MEKVELYQSEIEKLRPFEGEMLRQIKDFYKVGVTYSSNALEGNSLTESETKVLLEDGLTVGGKPMREIYEAVDHGKAYEYMFGLLHSHEITEENIKELHRLFYRNIDGAHAGVYRDFDVIITGSKYPTSAHSEIAKEMEELCKWMENERSNYHSVEFAAKLHKEFIFIHPFKDGNGRVARLLVNTVLIQDGYLPIVIPPILRHDYISSLEKAHRDDRDFTRFIIEREEESQKDILRLFHIPLPKLSENQKGMKML